MTVRDSAQLASRADAAGSLTTLYTYETNFNDRRLKRIEHQLPRAPLTAATDYSSDAQGRILTQAYAVSGSTPRNLGYGYDLAKGAGSLATWIVPDAVWNSAVLGITLGDASGAIVGSPFILGSKGNVLPCPIPE